MKRFFQIILIIASVFASASMASSCTKIEEVDYDIVGRWKFTGFNGEDYPDNYHFIQITNETIIVYDRYEDMVETFGYKRTKNTLKLTAPFAGKYTTILVDSASYDEKANLGQMSWYCGNGQNYYFSIW